MSKILIVTVGGSHQPIVTTIRSLQPDRVVFICSDGPRGSKFQVIGEGTPCEVRRGNEVLEHLPNIPTQAELGDRFQSDRDLIPIQNPDDLSECYREITQGLRKLQQDFPSGSFNADYTGGTKTMSVALSLAALDYGIPLFLTTSTTRPNIIRVEAGERTRRATTTALTVERKIEQSLSRYLHQYNYSAAISELNSLLQDMELSPEDSRRVQELLDCCTGLDAWDRFDHASALPLLQPYMNREEIRLLGIFLKQTITSRIQIDDQFTAGGGTKGHGYEIVQDLLLNAERRAIQQRYDDAVGRLYRALELLAQIYLLRSYKIKTGDVDIQKLPELLQELYEQKRSSEKGTIELALKDSYELLSAMPGDPLGQLYQDNRNRINDTLKVRNYSLFAHGFQPITKEIYQRFDEVIVKFILKGIACVIQSETQPKTPQFPQVMRL